MIHSVKLPVEIRRKAWYALVKELGIINALKYVMNAELGQGDSVEYYQDLWRDKSVDEVFAEIELRKKTNRLPLV